MRTHTTEQLAKMSKEHAAAEITNIVYEAALFFERLEDAGKIYGNGHHMAQELAVMAANMVRERWREPRPDETKGES